MQAGCTSCLIRLSFRSHHVDSSSSLLSVNCIHKIALTGCLSDEHGASMMGRAMFYLDSRGCVGKGVCERPLPPCAKAILTGWALTSFATRRGKAVAEASYLLQVSASPHQTNLQSMTRSLSCIIMGSESGIAVLFTYLLIYLFIYCSASARSPPPPAAGWFPFLERAACKQDVLAA